MVDRKFGELSEGERQLALLVRAMVKEPDLLVLDEPCQGLDPQKRARFVKLLDALLRKTDIALVLVTHDLEEIPPCVSHGLILKKGRKVLEGTAAEAITAYRG